MSNRRHKICPSCGHAHRCADVLRDADQARRAEAERDRQEAEADRRERREAARAEKRRAEKERRSAAARAIRQEEQKQARVRANEYQRRDAVVFQMAANEQPIDEIAWFLTREFACKEWPGDKRWPLSRARRYVARIMDTVEENMGRAFDEHGTPGSRNQHIVINGGPGKSFCARCQLVEHSHAYPMGVQLCAVAHPQEVLAATPYSYMEALDYISCEACARLAGITRRNPTSHQPWDEAEFQAWRRNGEAAARRCWPRILSTGEEKIHYTEAT